MNEYVGLTLVSTDGGDAIYETPKFSALEEGTEVFVEGFATGGKVRGTVLAYANFNKNEEEYAFVSKLDIGAFSLCNGSYKRVLSVIRENPMEWEE